MGEKSALLARLPGRCRKIPLSATADLDFLNPWRWVPGRILNPFLPNSPHKIRPRLFSLGVRRMNWISLAPSNFDPPAPRLARRRTQELSSCTTAGACSYGLVSAISLKTLEVGNPRSFAMALPERPCFRSLITSARCASNVGRRPSLTPLARAAARPAFTRSRITSRSKAATAQRMFIWSVAAGFVPEFSQL